MDFALAPARGKGGRRADQCGDGWNVDGAPTEADHKTVGLSKKTRLQTVSQFQADHCRCTAA
jgi:hypothetical protein